jgi:hypothetical protein
VKPLNRDQQIEMMANAAERHESVAARLMADKQVQSLVAPRSIDRATIAEIAARHSAVVAPDVRAVVVPRGVSAVPVPVWREGTSGLREGLYDPIGGESYRARMWGHAPPLQPTSTTKTVLSLHAEGKSNAEISAATGMTGRNIVKALRRNGLFSNKK